MSEKFFRDGKTVQIYIYREDDGSWKLEVIDEHNNSTAWGDPYPNEIATINEVHELIVKEGIGYSLRSTGSVEWLGNAACRS